MKNLSRTMILAAAGTAAVLVVTSSASGAGATAGPAAAMKAGTSVTLGQVTTVGPIGCGSPFTGVQASTGTGTPSYVTPFAGVVTSFSTQAGAAAGTMRLLLFTSTAPTTYQVIG